MWSPSERRADLTDYVWIPGKHSTRIEITACRGEYEPASFVIQPVVRDLRNLRISATDLIGGQGVISKDQIDIRFVKSWYQAGGAWDTIGLSNKGRSRVLIPELLLKNDALIHVDVDSKTNYARLRIPGANSLVSISKPGSIGGRLVKSTQEFPSLTLWIYSPWPRTVSGEATLADGACP